MIFCNCLGRFEFYKSKLPGVRIICCSPVHDARGFFLKTFTEDGFERCNLPTEFKDEFLSFSKKGVFRGFHFSVPPNEGAKLVQCISGVVWDVLIDLRKDSYGQSEINELNGDRPEIIFIPPGVAHGFYAVSDSIVTYKTTAAYMPEYDKGIRWDSCGIDFLKGENLILSDRDKEFPSLENYRSPFI